MHVGIMGKLHTRNIGFSDGCRIYWQGYQVKQSLCTVSKVNAMKIVFTKALEKNQCDYLTGLKFDPYRLGFVITNTVSIT